ncbi:MULTISPECIES: TetR/AcrR family transcriptional regulator [Serratia]|uniref:Putative transcriptional regulator n=1 Tax=Serratia quinivorans TaxID=137545 RepID=A0A380AG19_9GAMM|nr:MULTISPECIES: TetR/AcrR family transcriptional regulator [Serratia]QBX69124.1 TetR/AcrR family transcriptional regulator [Serratia quinivorans]RYM64651.1 TetR family transcriptional regulator [Serratia proteamaculans]CAI1546442.1 putative transcriptional regulator [Serratia quinivorans]SUI80392.1 putative transcriptional regulator [Serratia quinivorans]
MSVAPSTLPPRQRILLTAHDLFYRDGIRATGIDRIISESGVAKVTFYRHFPSKNELIEAFLAYRHDQWLSWFSRSLEQQATRRGDVMLALVPCLEEWFSSPHYRGCAFINTAVELADMLPESLKIARQHKKQMAEVIASHLPTIPEREQRAEMLSMLIDGAIVKVQIEQQPQNALLLLSEMLKTLAAAWKHQ